VASVILMMLAIQVVEDVDAMHCSRPTIFHCPGFFNTTHLDGHNMIMRITNGTDLYAYAI
jgi:hypothetical protein